MQRVEILPISRLNRGSMQSVLTYCSRYTYVGRNVASTADVDCTRRVPS